MRRRNPAVSIAFQIIFWVAACVASFSLILWVGEVARDARNESHSLPKNLEENYMDDNTEQVGGKKRIDIGTNPRVGPVIFDGQQIGTVHLREVFNANGEAVDQWQLTIFTDTDDLGGADRILREKIDLLYKVW